MSQELTGLLVRIRADLSDYVLKMAQMEQQTGGTSNRVATTLGKISTAAAGMAAGVTAAAGIAIKSAIEWGKAVDDLSDKTGMAGEESSKFLVIAQRTGMDLQTANAMWSKFGKAVFEAADAQVKAANSGKQAEDALSMLGIAATNADGTMRSASEIFQDVKDRLNEMPDGLQKAALEMKLFGRSGTEMHDILHMSNSEMEDAYKKAKALGLIMSSQTAAGIEQFDRDLNSAKGTISAVGMAIAVDAMPQIKELLDGTTKTVKAFIEWKNANPELASSLFDVAKGIAAVAIAIRGVGLALSITTAPPWLLALLAAAGVGYVGYKTATTSPLGEITEVSGAEMGAGGASVQPSVTAEESRTGWGERPSWDVSKSGESKDTFLGGGGGSSETALEKWIKANNEAMQIMQKRLELGEIDQQQFDAFLATQLEGLKNVAVGQDEQNKKLLQELELRTKIKESIKKQTEAIAEYFMKQSQEQANQTQKEFDETKKKSQEATQHEIRKLEAGFSPEEQLIKINSLLQSETEKFNQYLRGEIALTQDEATALYARIETLYNASQDKTRQMEIDQIAAAKRVNDAWADNLAAIISNTRSGHDVLRQMWYQFVADIIKAQFKFGGSGNVFTDIFGAAKQSGNKTNGLLGMGGFLGFLAEGGPAIAGQSYIVGERGPELFVPRTAGVVIPNNRLIAGGQNTQININVPISSPDPQESGNQVVKVMPIIKREIAAAIKEEPFMRNAVRTAVNG